MNDDLNGKTPEEAASAVMRQLEHWSIETEGPGETKLRTALFALIDKANARIRSI